MLMCRSEWGWSLPAAKIRGMSGNLAHGHTCLSKNIRPHTLQKPYRTPIDRSEWLERSDRVD